VRALGFGQEIEQTQREEPMSEPIMPFSEPSPVPSPDERRRAERFPSDQPSVCRIVSEGQEEGLQASVRDMSATGIGLLVNQPLKSGSVLILNLQTGRHRLARPLPVRVMHAAPAGEGNWLVGCQFVRRLSEPELNALLGEE
jgi:PilZ domain-containing protein